MLSYRPESDLHRTETGRSYHVDDPSSHRHDLAKVRNSLQRHQRYSSTAAPLFSFPL